MSSGSAALPMTAPDSRLIIPDMDLALRHSPYSVRLLLEFAAERGLEAAPLLAESGLAAVDLASSGATVSGREELALIDAVVRKLGDTPGLGLAMGQRYHLTSYGIWGFALLSAPTLRGAIETGVRYLDLTYSYLRLRLQDEGEHTRLVLDDREVPPGLRRFLLERDTAAITVIQRELFGAAASPAMRFALPRPPDLLPYRRLFGVEPEFDAVDTSVLLPRALLDAPLPQANPLAARLAEAQCSQLLSERRAHQGLAAQVREQLLRGLRVGRLPDMEAVATGLLMTSRTLRRRLGAEDTSFRALLDELRQTLAEELLGTAGLKVEEVAARLGYSDAVSFLHARRRWRLATSRPST